MKLKHIVIIFAEQHQQNKEKLIVQWMSTTSNQCCYFTLQNEVLSEPLLKTTKKSQNSTKKTDKSQKSVNA